MIYLFLLWRANHEHVIPVAENKNEYVCLFPVWCQYERTQPTLRGVYSAVSRYSKSIGPLCLLVVVFHYRFPLFRKESKGKPNGAK